MRIIRIEKQVPDDCFQCQFIINNYCKFFNRHMVLDSSIGKLIPCKACLDATVKEKKEYVLSN